ncbi:hypothetical protein [Streptomyces sp. NPDC126514]|uniref:hypothetical protein n=1 Tax=Streptomyces sp. NPDC126514 TaxID=3155210 RepID=UPI003324FECC
MTNGNARRPRWLAQEMTQEFVQEMLPRRARGWGLSGCSPAARAPGDRRRRANLADFLREGTQPERLEALFVHRRLPPAKPRKPGPGRERQAA